MLERDVLDHAWRLIERSDDWTQSAAARNRRGARVAPDDPGACRWCAIGAVEKAVADKGLDDGLLFDAINRLCRSAKDLFGTRFLTFVNDRQDHPAMRRLFAHAIAGCERDAAIEAQSEPPELERLRAMLGFCLGYIDQLERKVHAHDGRLQHHGRVAGR